MTIPVYTAIGIVLLISILFYYYNARKNMTKASNHVAEHRIIKQQIKITDDKVVDLEIRVKVLEEK